MVMVSVYCNWENHIIAGRSWRWKIDIVTDDNDQRIDTILDVEDQRRSLKVLAEKYTAIRKADYLAWRARLENEMEKVEEK